MPVHKARFACVHGHCAFIGMVASAFYYTWGASIAALLRRVENGRPPILTYAQLGAIGVGPGGRRLRSDDPFISQFVAAATEGPLSMDAA